VPCEQSNWHPLCIKAHLAQPASHARGQPPWAESPQITSILEKQRHHDGQANSSLRTTRISQLWQNKAQSGKIGSMAADRNRGPRSVMVEQWLRSQWGVTTCATPANSSSDPALISPQRRGRCYRGSGHCDRPWGPDVWGNDASKTTASFELRLCFFPQRREPCNLVHTARGLAKWPFVGLPARPTTGGIDLALTTRSSAHCTFANGVDASHDFFH
jgi:hypothetical protein